MFRSEAARMTPFPHPRPTGPCTLRRIRAMWLSGMDTVAIAQRLGMSEAAVHNALPAAKRTI